MVKVPDELWRKFDVCMDTCGVMERERGDRPQAVDELEVAP
jgi:hypothetical protein